MGPITMYSSKDLGEKDQDKVKWIDNGENKKEVLRTNPSETDLCLKEVVEPIISHKQEPSKSIMKVKQPSFTYQIEKVEIDESLKPDPMPESQTFDV